MVRLRGIAAAAILAILLLIAGLAGCSAAPTSTAMPTGSDVPAGSLGAAATPPVVEGEAVESLIRAARLEDDASITALESVRFTKEGRDAAARVLASNPTGDTLWAATWIYASSSSADAAPLKALLANDDASIRALAAAALTSWGDPTGVAALGPLLSEPGQLRGSHPPLLIADFALSTASRFIHATGAPADPVDGEGVESAAAAWKVWLGEHASALRFDAATSTWTL